MKIRNSFVSNSSSSSFVVQKYYISEQQMDYIRNHIEIAKQLGIECGCTREEDAWTVEETNGMIRLSTYMDNFDMIEFLNAIGVPDEAIDWQNSYSENYDEDPCGFR